MECVLESCESRHSPIPLPHRTPVTIGRSPRTLIQDDKVSRKQVELTANCESQKVHVKQLGWRPCEVRGELLKTGLNTSMNTGDILHLIPGLYPCRVKFNKTGAKKNQQDQPSSRGQKRAAGSQSGNDTKKYKSNSEDDEEHDMDDVAAQLKAMRDSALKATPKPSSSAAATAGASDAQEMGAEATHSHWKTHSNLHIYTSQGTKSSSKIAGFDIDGTIIATASGKRFPVNAKDWKILMPEVSRKLKKLHGSGFKLVFFTNQMGIARGRVKLEEFKEKVENIVERIGVPIQVFVAAGAGPFRKPAPGMWDYLCEHQNDGIKVLKDKSYYVGDAAGRPDKWALKRKKDFACSDRLFAINVGIGFHTPEEFFLEHRKAPFDMPEFDPRALKYDDEVDVTVNKKQEMIVCVGLPASGKTSFCKMHLEPKGYVTINRDSLGSSQKCVKLCQTSLDGGKSIVVDNTNPDLASREKYIEMANKAGVPCRCFHFSTSFAHCRHNERFREITDKSHQTISDMIMYSIRNKFVAPQTSEGFSEVKEIKIVPQFSNEADRRLYQCFLL